jgi:hypothetical protein
VARGEAEAWGGGVRLLTVLYIQNVWATKTTPGRSGQLSNYRQIWQEREGKGCRPLQYKISLAGHLYLCRSRSI